VKRTKRLVLRVAVIFVAVGSLLALDGTANAARQAQAVDYPSWADVQAARASEAAGQLEINRIQSLLAQMQKTLELAQATEQAAGTAYDDAQRALDEQTFIAGQLDAQAQAAQSKADAAQLAAGRLLGALGKGGNEDLTTSLIARPGNADDLLYRLSALSRLSVQSEGVYAKALQLKNSAASLTEQARRAQAKLAQLRDTAQAALLTAQAAADAANTALLAQQDHQLQLQAQLSVLVQKRQVTEADYSAGVAARNAATAVGKVNAQGWARPVSGYIISPFGMRLHPIYKVWKLHTGVDIAGQGCGAPIFAAHSGRVTYAGWNGDLGIYVQIDHGDGTSTGYAHIVNGGLLVARGDDVASGQQIARVGTTGGSTGCHLHFITRINGALTDPVPFLRERGVSLG
jgi:murein DD-endopeptidase MepM/ murein hydrolase activator NlpD